MSGRRKATPSRASKRGGSASKSDRPPKRAAGKKPATRPGSKPTKKPGKKLSRGRLIGRILGWLSLLFLLAVLGGIGAFLYAYSHITIPTPNVDFQAQTTFVYYSDGKTQVGHLPVSQDATFQNRSDVSLADLPDSVKWAVISAEDRTFESNVGVDPKGIIRATINDVMGHSLQGASTITQQYVKVLYLNQERTVTRKITEGILALKISQTESKDQILQGYLNTIYFGRGAYGIQAAAHAYFNKDAAHLNVKQAAVLASVINNPTGFDPANGSAAEQALLERYQYVISGMEQMGKLDPADAEKYSAALPKFPPANNADNNGDQRGHILTMVRQILLDQGFTPTEIDSGGLRVYTTIDEKLQSDAEKAIKNQRPKGFGDKQLHAALASVEPGTGALRAMYAGQDYLKSQLNWANLDEVPGPGSTFKPFTLAAGLEYGYSLQSTFQGNSPIKVGGRLFHNEGAGAGNNYGKHVSLLRGLELSINTVYIDLVRSMGLTDGPKNVIDVTSKLGISPDNTKGLNEEVGVTLGSAGVSPIRMATAYAAFADHGIYAPWYVVDKVTDSDGNVLYQHRTQTKNAMPTDVAADATYAMQQVVKQGTGTAARALGRPAAGKTGTATNSNGDVVSAWFVGFTPQLSTAVMYIRSNPKTGAYLRLDHWLPSYYGGTYPARTWTAFMSRALKGKKVLDFPPPANLPATRLDHPPFTPSPSPTPTATPTATDTTSPTATATNTPQGPPGGQPPGGG